MKLSISNIIWEKGKQEFELFLQFLKSNQINSIELSLNSIFEEPLNMTVNDKKWLKSLLEHYSISVSSLHSLTYTRPDLEIFNTKRKRQELLNYLFFYIDIAREFNTKNLVYGSPKSRKIHGKQKLEINEIFSDFLLNLDQNLEGLCFNIEPLPMAYCEYLNTFMEGVEIIEKENFKNIYVQLDVRSIIENSENIENIFKKFQYIKHVHVGEPKLRMPSIEYKDIHKDINDNLNKMKYDKYISIEVLNHQDISSNYIFETINSTRKFYNDRA